MKKLSQDSQSMGQDFNLEPPIYRSLSLNRNFHCLKHKCNYSQQNTSCIFSSNINQCGKHNAATVPKYQALVDTFTYKSLFSVTIMQNLPHLTLELLNICNTYNILSITLKGNKFCVTVLPYNVTSSRHTFTRNY
jgi:hypothetical protein